LVHRMSMDNTYEVIEAVDGEEGMRKIREEKPDLILLDMKRR